MALPVVVFPVHVAAEYPRRDQIDKPIGGTPSPGTLPRHARVDQHPQRGTSQTRRHRVGPLGSHLTMSAHSARNAISGSTFVARRAGIMLAARATAQSRHDTPTKVSGSVTLTPRSWLATSRVS